MESDARTQSGENSMINPYSPSVHLSVRSSPFDYRTTLLTASSILFGIELLVCFACCVSPRIPLYYKWSLALFPLLCGPTSFSLFWRSKYLSGLAVSTGHLFWVYQVVSIIIEWWNLT